MEGRAGSVGSDATELQWRVRNINRAIEPRSGSLLESEGVGEERLGRWDY